MYTNAYWPRKALVTAWLRENWDTWTDEATRPRWFRGERGKRWRAMFPPGWLPERLDIMHTSTSWQGRFRRVVNSGDVRDFRHRECKVLPGDEAGHDGDG